MSHPSATAYARLERRVDAQTTLIADLREEIRTLKSKIAATDVIGGPGTRTVLAGGGGGAGFPPGCMTVIDRKVDHPFDLLYQLGFRVTVNTDNRLQSGTSLTRELALLVDAFGYDLDDLETFQLNVTSSVVNVWPPLVVNVQ